MLWSLLVWVVFGFVVGLVARAVMPGKQPLGFWATAGVGIGGSFVGGLLSTVVVGRPIGFAHPAGFVGSVIGALILLGVVTFFRGGAGRRAGR